MHEFSRRRWPRHAPSLVWAGLSAAALSIYAILPSWMLRTGPSPQPSAVVLLHLLDAGVVWACVTILNPWLERRYPRALAPRMALGLLTVIAGIGVVTAAVHQLMPSPLPVAASIVGQEFAVPYRALMVALFVYGWLQLRDHARGEAAHASSVRMETDALATAVDRSELAMLEAQIEPHFLFNTLAHIKRLYRTDRAAADLTLRDLIAYLERAAPALRQPGWQLGDELELVTLYLRLIAQRFGARLHYFIDAQPCVFTTKLPALCIATLVENAVRHGVGPKAGEGTIRIGATVSGDELSITVADDGVGLRQTSGGGLGLATVRARLQGQFGRAGATLTVAPGSCGGVCASIRIARGGEHA